MRFRRRVAANGTKVPPLPSPRAAPALTPIFALAPILARAPIPKPARRCCHRPSSASPLASDAERPPASTLATSPPLRPSALAFPSRLPISPSHLNPPSRPQHLAYIVRVSPLCVHAPRVRPRAFARARPPPPGRSVSASARPSRRLRAATPEPHEPWEISGDLGDLAPQPAPPHVLSSVCSPASCV